MQKDIQEIISCETNLKAFLQDYSEKKIIIEFEKKLAKDFENVKEHPNVFYYGIFHQMHRVYYKGIKADASLSPNFDKNFDNTKKIISGTEYAWEGTKWKFIEYLKIIIL
jgi:hypothetical protein